MDIAAKNGHIQDYDTKKEENFKNWVLETQQEGWVVVASNGLNAAVVWVVDIKGERDREIGCSVKCKLDIIRKEKKCHFIKLLIATWLIPSKISQFVMVGLQLMIPSKNSHIVMVGV